MVPGKKRLGKKGEPVSLLEGDSTNSLWGYPCCFSNKLFAVRVILLKIIYKAFSHKQWVH